MPEGFRMQIQDVFRFRDGRTVFVGPTEGGPSYIGAGLAEILHEGELCAVIRIEGESLSVGPTPNSSSHRSISTAELHALDHESFTAKAGRWEMKSFEESAEANRAHLLENRNSLMHRHLLGIESPPSEYVPDPMTLGPVLPEGWDGDAWLDPGGRKYFLRAWNKTTSRIAYGSGSSYEEARRLLLRKVVNPTERVTIAISEAGGS